MITVGSTPSALATDAARVTTACSRNSLHAFTGTPSTAWGTPSCTIGTSLAQLLPKYPLQFVAFMRTSLLFGGEVRRKFPKVGNAWDFPSRLWSITLRTYLLQSNGASARS